MRKFIASILFICLISTTASFGQLNKAYYVWTGQGLVMESRYKEAIETLNILLKSDTTAYEAYFMRGIAKYNLDDLLGAEYDFTLAIEKNPVFTTAYQFRAITRSQLGNYDTALQDFKEAIDLRPDKSDAYFSRGVTYLLTQQFQKAVDDFDMFIRRNDKVAEAYINRGLAYQHLKDTVSAYSNYEEGIRTNRNHPRGYVQRGTLYMEENKYDEALADFDMAIRNDSTYILAYFNRALVHSRTDKPSLALDDLDKVLAIDSTNSVTYFNRAILRAQIGDYNRAMEDYNKVAAFSPGNVIVYYNRAGLNYQLGYLDEALKDYNKAIELYPDFANAYINRASVKYLLRDTKGARKDQLTAEKKIAEYRSKLTEESFSIYADTSRNFNALMSFDSKLSGSTFNKIQSEDGKSITMRPMYRFTLRKSTDEEIKTIERYDRSRVDEFIALLKEPMIILSNKESNLSADTLIAMGKTFARQLSHGKSSLWELLFKSGITQSLIKQYTNSVNTYSDAIDSNPTNPFLYINRSVTRAEMIDFISSIDNDYNQISLDSDPSPRLRSNFSRTYNYDEAIADLNKAAKLYPEFAYTYYNRANLLALSGKLPEAYEDYTHAIELMPDFADAYFNRGLVQIYMKDTRKGLLDISKSGELGIKEAYDILKAYSNNIK